MPVSHQVPMWMPCHPLRFQYPALLLPSYVAFDSEPCIGSVPTWIRSSPSLGSVTLCWASCLCRRLPHPPELWPHEPASPTQGHPPYSAQSLTAYWCQCSLTHGCFPLLLWEWTPCVCFCKVVKWFIHFFPLKAGLFYLSYFNSSGIDLYRAWGRCQYPFLKLWLSDWPTIYCKEHNSPQKPYTLIYFKMYFFGGLGGSVS